MTHSSDGTGTGIGTGSGATAGGPSRRTALKVGLGVVVGAGAIGTRAPAAIANGPFDPTSPTIAVKVKNLSGPAETGRFGAAWTDLGIPVRCPDGSMLFVCGDTFAGDRVGAGEWNAPVGLRSGSADLNNLRIDGIVQGAHGISLVDEPHNPVGEGATTAIPSDAFVVDGVLYMHLMRGVIYDTHHTDFWRSTDNGRTWEYLCQWPGDLHGGQFQQKTYAVANDGYCYVLSTVFNREVESGMLLHRVRQDRLGDPDAYEPWGWTPDDGWRWNAPAPTSVFGTRKWGELCFRAMGGKYVLTWLNMNPLSIRAMVFPLPTSDLTRTLEQTMILPGAPGQEIGNLVAAPYGGFVVPGSTFADFHIVVSQWYDPVNYRIMQYRIAGVLS
ncbi:DUF4185 domain-containing protein [Kitasatospora sp. NPDC093806]|uniref:DUF4185 domain-containing protein n=1 Tax=Kitasatospora sp. NPDC093806 TaxID=3155075 RepID=UPI00344A09EF